uniref:Selenoprotein P N-terminal domain-containing protein n=1 Tax=Ailuropoda melanoleuca TaxID=9646 RepID=A0A7N5JEY1_AILME
MWRSLGLALALCLLPWGGTESQGQSSFCKQPPAWSIRDQSPMLNSGGSVTVVALLQASYLCILQASRPRKLKTSVKWYLRLLWEPQQRLPRHITTTSTITNTGIRIMGTMSFQRISNQKQNRLGSIPLLEAFIATISSRTTKDRATLRTEICQPEVKIYNFRSHKSPSDERAV